MAKAKIAFTDNAVKSAPPGRHSTELCAGLWLRVTKSVGDRKGVRTFFFHYHSKITKKTQDETIGHYPATSLREARVRADLWRAQNDRGERLTAFLPAKKDEPTWTSLLADYNVQKLKQMRTGNKMLVALTNVGKDNGWTDLAVSQISRDVIRAALKKIIARGSLDNANKVQQMISTLFNWGIETEIITTNPISGMKRMSGKKEDTIRDRKLDPEEIRTLWPALTHPERYGINPTGARALYLILVTTARPHMVTDMERSELKGSPALNPKYRMTKNDDGPRLELPNNRMKKNRDFVLPLNSLAVGAIGAVPVDQKYICPKLAAHAKKPTLRVPRLARIAEQICKKLGMKKWRPHDLRRTGSNFLTSTKRKDGKRWSEDDVAKLMSHEKIGRGAMRNYNSWNYFDEKRQMSDFLAEILIDIVSDIDTNVIELPIAA